MKRWLYPGSFDPFTLGHLNVCERASLLCDEIIIAVLPNEGKAGAFTPEQRVDIIEKSLEHAGITNARAIVYYGLLVDLMQQEDIEVVVRGLRSESDFRYEAEMMTANRLLYEGYESVYFITTPDMSFTSSSIVREIASLGGDLSGMVSPNVAEFVAQVLHRRRLPRVE